MHHEPHTREAAAFNGRRILVTGGTKGIGEAMVERLMRGGGKVITTAPIGDHVDATAFDADSRLIFNSNGEGTITVIHQDTPDKYSVVETVKTVPRAKTMAFDRKTHQLFLSTAEGGQSRCESVGNVR